MMATMKALAVTLLALNACAPPPTVTFSIPASSAAADLHNESVVVKAVNDAVGCTVVTITESETATSLAANTFAFAYTEGDQNTLFEAGDDGFYQPANNSVLIFPTDTNLQGPNGEPLGDEQAQRDILHEIGHAFGLQHTTTPGAVMNTSATVAPLKVFLPEFVSELRDLAGVSCPSK